jgi:hypothetical protein
LPWQKQGEKDPHLFLCGEGKTSAQSNDGEQEKEEKEKGIGKVGPGREIRF